MQVLKLVALMALASSAMASVVSEVPAVDAPLLRCMNSILNVGAGTLVVELSTNNAAGSPKQFGAVTVDVRNSANSYVCYTQVFPANGKPVANLWFGPNGHAADSIIYPWTCPLGTCSTIPVPCGDALTVTVTNGDGRVSRITCPTSACPAPPPVASPPPVVASPPPYVPPCAAPTLKCLSTGSWTSSLAVEVSVAGFTHANKYQTFTIEANTDKGSFCKASVTPRAGRDTIAYWFGPAPAEANIHPWTSTTISGNCAATVPCGTQFVVTIKNSDGQMSITTCYSSACPAVSSPPPYVCSPPPAVCSPPPAHIASPPPYVCSPPPYVCSPPPVRVNSPPPCVASPPPYCAPVTAKSPPPYCAPVTVKSPPPYCAPVTVHKPPYCAPVTVHKPPYCAPVTVSKPPPYCAPVTIHKPKPVYPQCGVSKWGKPVYCKRGQKCCTVTIKKWYGKTCKVSTKQQCMRKCPKH